jgi:dTDP-4-dehydrorhamnose reductase
VLITGASGLVGTWLRRTMPADVELMACLHETPVSGIDSVSADLRDRDSAMAALSVAQPSIVVHAAMALDSASIVDATRNVTEAASLVGADVVYISTDAVFSGDGRRVAESARPDPIWPYGEWKAMAEDVVSARSPRSAVVRLPLVVSVDPADAVVEKIRSGAEAGVPTRWFHDETRQPAMAPDVAAAIWRIVQLRVDRRAGVWHLPGPERLTRYEIGQRVVASLGLDPGCIMRASTPPDQVRPRHINMLAGRAHAEIAWEPDRVLC